MLCGILKVFHDISLVHMPVLFWVNFVFKIKQFILIFVFAVKSDITIPFGGNLSFSRTIPDLNTYDGYTVNFYNLDSTDDQIPVPILCARHPNCVQRCCIKDNIVNVQIHHVNKTNEGCYKFRGSDHQQIIRVLGESFTCT